MTNAKIAEVLDRYELALSTTNEKQLLHCRSMIPRMRVFLAEGRRGKVFHLLGFMQGVFWANGLYILKELEDHNCPGERTECCGKGPYAD